jgi:hypothetical protein
MLSPPMLVWPSMLCASLGIVGEVDELDGDHNEAQMFKLHVVPIRCVYVHTNSCNLVSILMPLHAIDGTKHGRDF